MRNATFGLVLLGCASAAGGAPLLQLSDFAPASGQACNISGGHFPLQVLVDSAAAVAAVDALRPGDGAVVLSVSTDSTGARARYRRIETTWEPSAAEAVQEALAPLIGGRSPRALRGRLLVQRAGATTQLAVGASQFCRPALANRPDIQKGLIEVYRKHFREGTVNVWLFVDTTGAVTRAQIQRGTGDIAFDASVLEVGRRARMHPALDDRQPRPVWASLDLTVQLAQLCPGRDSLIFAPGSPDPCRSIPPRRRR